MKDIFGAMPPIKTIEGGLVVTRYYFKDGRVDREYRVTYNGKDETYFEHYKSYSENGDVVDEEYSINFIDCTKEEWETAVNNFKFIAAFNELLEKE